MLLESFHPVVPGGKQPPPDGLLKVPELESVLESEDQRVPAGLMDPVGVSPLVVQCVEFLHVEESRAVRGPLEDEVESHGSKGFFQGIFNNLPVALIFLQIQVFGLPGHFNTVEGKVQGRVVKFSLAHRIFALRNLSAQVEQFFSSLQPLVRRPDFSLNGVDPSIGTGKICVVVSCQPLNFLDCLSICFRGLPVLGDKRREGRCLLKGLLLKLLQPLYGLGKVVRGSNL